MRRLTYISLALSGLTTLLINFPAVLLAQTEQKPVTQNQLSPYLETGEVSSTRLCSELS